MTTNISAIIAQLPQQLQEQIPHYEDTMQPNMYAAIGISLILVYACVGLRIYGRRLQGLDLWWDDYMSIVALFFTSITVAMLLYLTYLGFGRHEIVGVLEHGEKIGIFLRVLIGLDALYFLPVCFAKLSILFQYRRLFPSKRFKLVLIAVGVASTIYCLVSMSVVTALCLPIKVPTLENPLAQPLACANNIEYILLWICSTNAAFDLIILFLPMHYVWCLNTTFRRKLQLTVLFLLGSFVVAISILRTWYFTQLDFGDFTWTGAMGHMWTEVEGCLAIVAGCLPAMMPIFRRSRNGFGRKGSPYKSTENLNMVTIGSGGRKQKLKDISITMQTTVTTTAHGDGNYTELINQPGQENQTKYYYGEGRW